MSSKSKAVISIRGAWVSPFPSVEEAYYDFNETTGSSLPDLTSNSNNGTTWNKWVGDLTNIDNLLRRPVLKDEDIIQDLLKELRHSKKIIFEFFDNVKVND